MTWPIPYNSEKREREIKNCLDKMEKLEKLGVNFSDLLLYAKHLFYENPIGCMIIQIIEHNKGLVSEDVLEDVLVNDLGWINHDVFKKVMEKMNELEIRK